MLGMARTKLPPHLMTDRSNNVKRCSVCGHPFESDAQPSVSKAFAEHVLKAHRPGQTSEDVNQAAARIVGETTEGR